MTGPEPRQTRVYDSPPSLAPLFVKAALPILPGVSKLPVVGRRGDAAPDLEIVRERVRVDPDHLAAYSSVCDFGLADALPPTYPHVLAFPLQMALMTDGSFPFAPIGAVHAANTITQRRPLRVDEEFDLAVRADHLRAHAKGRLIDIVTTATVDSEPVWQETMTILRRGRVETEATDSLPLRDVEAPVGPARWMVPRGLGRRYAAVAGDRNPIHLSVVTARIFGFSRPIIHGMWTKARCLASLQARLPDAYTVEVAFRRPISIPGSVRFGSQVDGERTIFGVTGARDATPHLVGVVEPDRSIG